MNQKVKPDPASVMDHVREVERERADTVREFGLRFALGGAVQSGEYIGWYVLVYSDRSGVEAERLVDALRELERLVEQRSGMDISLMLALPDSSNGVHH